MKHSMELGAVAKDLVTGFEGVVICRAEWLNGCKRATIQPRKLIEGKPIESQCFDEDQLEVTQPASRTHFQNGTGGPYPAQKPF